MTLNQMRYFVTLAESASYTEASKLLFITQSNLSRQIQSMEDELGLQLIVRHTRRFKLTPAGSLLYQRFKNILSDYSFALTEAINISKGMEGSLSIGILDIYDISHYYPTILPKVQKNHPELELHLSRRSLGEIVEDLKNQKIDLAITYSFSLFDQPNLILVDAGTFNSCIMMNKNHPLAKKKNLALSDLKDQTFIQVDPGASLEGDRYINSLMAHAGLHPQIKYVNSMNDIRLWIETGNAVSITADCTIEKENPNLRIIPIDMPEAKGHGLSFAWKKDNYNPAIAVFMEAVEQEVLSQN